MIFVVLPIFNEVDNLRPLFAKIDAACKALARDYRIIAVDDGSRDGSGELIAELAEIYPTEIIVHRRNRGLGETIRDGFEAAADLARAGDIITRMDADNTHDPAYLSPLIAKIESGYDVAVCSRFPEGGGQVGVTPGRSLISKMANIFFRMVFPLGGVREYTCGFRAYRAEVIQQALQVYQNSFIQLRGLGFCCTVEKLLKLRVLGARIGEVPFTLRYDLKKGNSKMALNVTTFGYLVMVILYHWPSGGWRTVGRRWKVAAQLGSRRESAQP